MDRRKFIKGLGVLAGALFANPFVNFLPKPADPIVLAPVMSEAELIERWNMAAAQEIRNSIDRDMLNFIMSDSGTLQPEQEETTKWE